MSGSTLTLKVKTKDGREHIVADLTSGATVAQLQQRLAAVTGIAANRLQVLLGFPPKRIDLSDATQTLDACGIRNGLKLIVEEGSAPAAEAPAASTPSSSTAAAAAAAAGGGAPGTSFAEEARAATIAFGADVDVEQHESIDNGFSAGILLKKVVPSDNSCLFTSIGYLLNGRVDPECAHFMREIIATTVAKDLESYSPAVLGKSNAEYCEWIQRPESWGGAIEVSILSTFYGIEFAVVDIINGIINHFGEDQKFGCRSFLLYDGIHYDPLYLEQMNGETKTMFEITDEAVLLQAHQLAGEAKTSRQYTDVDKFTLKCRDCDQALTGQTAAQEHAQRTGHTNFSEL